MQRSRSTSGGETSIICAEAFSGSAVATRFSACPTSPCDANDSSLTAAALALPPVDLGREVHRDGSAPRTADLLIAPAGTA
jgi:hypothetical protein